MINLNGNSSSSRQVTFITHPSIQSKAFASYLSETLMAPVVLQNINKPLAQRLAQDNNAMRARIDIRLKTMQDDRKLRI